MPNFVTIGLKIVDSMVGPILAFSLTKPAAFAEATAQQVNNYFSQKVTSDT